MSPAEVQKNIQELESLQSRLRRWRVGATLAIIAIVVVCVWRLIDGVNGLVSAGPRQEVFLGDLTAGLKSNVAPEVQKIATQAFYDIKPAVEREMRKLNDRAPDVAAVLKRETEALVHNLPVRGGRVLDASFGGMLRKREAKIRKMYPDVTEEKVASLVVNLVAETHDQMSNVTDTLFAQHIVALNGILEQVSEIQRTEKVNSQEEFPTWEMASLAIDLLHDEFKDLADSGEEPHVPPKRESRNRKEARQ